MRIVTSGSDEAPIYLVNLDSVTIWMDSVNMTMTQVGLKTFKIYRCLDLKTYGPTVWRDTPGFSQATRTDDESIGDKNYQIQFHLDDDYDSSFPSKYHNSHNERWKF